MICFSSCYDRLRTLTVSSRGNFFWRCHRQYLRSSIAGNCFLHWIQLCAYAIVLLVCTTHLVAALPLLTKVSYCLIFRPVNQYCSASILLTTTRYRIELCVLYCLLIATTSLLLLTLIASVHYSPYFVPLRTAGCCHVVQLPNILLPATKALSWSGYCFHKLKAAYCWAPGPRFLSDTLSYESSCRLNPVLSFVRVVNLFERVLTTLILSRLLKLDLSYSKSDTKNQ